MGAFSEVNIFIYSLGELEQNQIEKLQNFAKHLDDKEKNYMKMEKVGEVKVYGMKLIESIIQVVEYKRSKLLFAERSCTTAEDCTPILQDRMLIRKNSADRGLLHIGFKHSKEFKDYLTEFNMYKKISLSQTYVEHIFDVFEILVKNSRKEDNIFKGKLDAINGKKKQNYDPNIDEIMRLEEFLSGGIREGMRKKNEKLLEQASEIHQKKEDNRMKFMRTVKKGPLIYMHMQLILHCLIEELLKDHISDLLTHINNAPSQARMNKRSTATFKIEKENKKCFKLNVELKTKEIVNFHRCRSDDVTNLIILKSD